MKIKQMYRVRQRRAIPTAARCGLHPLWVAAVISLTLSGCATNPDPHEGGFVNGVVGLAGGGYQRRIESRQGGYQSELDAQARLMAEAQALEQERAALRGELSSAQARLAAQRRRIAQARSRLLARPGGRAAASGELGQLDLAEAQAVRAGDALRAVDAEAQPVADLKARWADIRRQLDEIDTMVSVVGSAAF